MLIDFTFKNYKSFLDLTNLSLEADGIIDFNSTVIDQGKLKLLPVAAIFGSNESGKSNLINAFQYMKKKITDSSYREVEPFAFAKEKQNSYFSAKILTCQNKIVTYSFALDKNGTVVKESLKVRKENSKRFKQIFTRSETGISLNKSIKKYEKNLTAFLDKYVLLLNFFKNLEEESINEVYEWFEEVDVINFSKYSEIDLVKTNLKPILDNEQFKKSLLSFLGSIDSSIKDISYESIPKPGFLTKHLKNDDEFLLPLEEESVGILKMIGLFFYLAKSLKLGIPLFIDELDSKLHPLLLRYIVVNFTNKEHNSNHAQLIFTSHDFSLMNMNLLRRDEIWFVEKDNNISDLYSLSDFRDDNNKRIRSDENFINDYFLGRFGSIPNLQDASILDLE